MSSDGSVTRLIVMLKGGNRAASQRLWEAYFGRLVGLARARLRGVSGRMADEEDVALSAFESFYRRAERGQFPQLEDRDDLWQLLFVLTVRKAINLVQYQGRKSRGGGRVQSLADLDLVGTEAILGADPSPELGGADDRGVSAAPRATARRVAPQRGPLEDGGIHQRRDRRATWVCPAYGGAQAPGDPNLVVGRGTKMSDPESRDSEGLSPTILGQIELICDRFESAWRGEAKPRIEDYWREADGPDLLRELLVLELAYRLRRHEHPSPADYRPRFAAHPEVIRSAFETVPTRRPSPGPPAPAASRSDADRNLLFGVLAMQMDFVTGEAPDRRRQRVGAGQVAAARSDPGRTRGLRRRRARPAGAADPQAPRASRRRSRAEPGVGRITRNGPGGAPKRRRPGAGCQPGRPR